MLAVDLAWGRAVEEARARGDRFLPPYPDTPGQPQMIFLNVDHPEWDEYRDEPIDRSDPEGLSDEAKARRGLADRLAQTLTDPPYGRVGHDAVAGLSVSTPVDYVPAVKQALADAPGVAEQNRPSEVRIGSGTGGVVIRVHGDVWSLVFRLSPVMSPVLVCTDDMPGRAYRIDQDQDWWPEIHRTLSAVVHELTRFSMDGDRFPDPLYERIQRERGQGER